jgi:flavorubredoxin
MSPIINLAPGVDVIANAYEVDGRVSWHAKEVRGWAPANCGLLREGDRALLIDTGLTIHRQEVLSSLRTLLDDETRLEVLTTRVGEFDSVCNLVEIIEAFGVRKQFAAFGDAPWWGDFHPDRRLADVPWASEIATELLPTNSVLEVGPGRVLDVIQPSLRNLSTYWSYDRTSRTLFTADSFCYGVGPSAAGPWVIDGEETSDDISFEQVERHLLTGSRFWWLEGSRLDVIRTEVAEIFRRFQVDAIVPSFGSILQGPEVVQRHVELLDAALEEIDETRKEAA